MKFEKLFHIHSLFAVFLKSPFFCFLVLHVLPTHCRCRGLLLYLITLNDTHTHTHTHAHAHTPGRTTWTTDRPVTKTFMRQYTTCIRDIHALCGIRIRNPRKGATTYQRLRPRSQQDRLLKFRSGYCSWEWYHLYSLLQLRMVPLIFCTSLLSTTLITSVFLLNSVIPLMN